MLFSVFGRSVEVHYCNGELTEAAIFGSVDCCCLAKQTDSLPESCHQKTEEHCHPADDDNSDHDTTLNETCCETALIEFFNTVHLDLSHQQTMQSLVFVIALVNPYLFSSLSSSEQVFVHYEQPLLWSDLSIKFRNFLI